MKISFAKGVMLCAVLVFMGGLYILTHNILSGYPDQMEDHLFVLVFTLLNAGSIALFATIKPHRISNNLLRKGAIFYAAAVIGFYCFMILNLMFINPDPQNGLFFLWAPFLNLLLYMILVIKIGLLRGR